MMFRIKSVERTRDERTGNVPKIGALAQFKLGHYQSGRDWNRGRKGD